MIPCLNEEKYIGTILNDLKNQTKKPNKVIIADADSSDNTKKVITSFKKDLKIKLIKGDMPWTSRNRGARLSSKNALVFFFDADVSIDKDFIENAIKEMQNKKLDGSTCHNLPFYRKWEKGYKNKFFRSVDSFYYFMHNLGLDFLAFFKFPVATGTCIISTRKAFDKAEGFPEHMTAFEDSEFARRVSKNDKFGILKSVKVKVSTRRFDSKGRFVFQLKLLLYAVLFPLFNINKQMQYFDKRKKRKKKSK